MISILESKKNELEIELRNQEGKNKYLENALKEENRIINEKNLILKKQRDELKTKIEQQNNFN